MQGPVAAHYNQSVEHEWNRLTRSPYRRLEFEVAWNCLQSLAPPPARVLDVGGGPGRYAIALARAGCKVSLTDCAENAIEFARRKIQGMGLADRFEDVRAADARDLGAYPANRFGAVLCMGPLYHLPRREDRLLCLSECARVLRPGGYLLAVVIPRESFVRDALRTGSYAAMAREAPGIFEEILRKGYSPRARVPNMHYCRADEARGEMEERGLILLETASLHGPVAFMEDAVNEAARDPAAWSALLKWVLETKAEPASTACAEYLLCIAEKSAG